MPSVTRIAPTSGQVITATSGSASVTFQWSYPKPTVAYELNYRLASASAWTTVAETTAASTKTLTLSEGEYVWQVRVKDDRNVWQAWTDTSTFGVYDAPTVAITTPGSTVTSWPMSYAFTFSDDNGSFAGGNIEMTLNIPPYTNVLNKQITSLTGTITNSDWLPVNGPYRFKFTAQSSTTLSASAQKLVTVNIAGTDQGMLDITNDPDTGYAHLVVEWDNSGGVHATYASVYRVYNGTRALVADNLSQDAYVVDKYAPLNVDYTYEVVTHAEPTAVTTKTFTNKIVTDRWFAIWNNGNNQAWAEWNPTGSYSLTRPQKKRVHYVGREYPVSYDGTALDEVHSISFTVVNMDSWTNGFIQLMHDGGRGIYKSVDGKVFWADFEITNSPLYTSITKLGTIALTITRIEGDVL